MVNIIRLSNGISVAMEEIPYVRSVSFGIWVKNGSGNETKQTNGASHFIEHMLFKGTLTKSAKEIAEEMDSLGGQINAYTTKEYTCYYTRVLDSHFDRALAVMSDMFLNSRFDGGDMERERQVILEEIMMYDDLPEELSHDRLQEGIWQGSPLSMPILGTKESLPGLSRNVVTDYMKRRYHTENTVISVAGNFKSAEMAEKLEKSFGSFKPGLPFVKEEIKGEYKPFKVSIKKDIEQVHMCLTFPGIERNSPQKYAMSIFNALFGGGLSSVLFQKIREEAGLTYSIYSYVTTFEHCGTFSIYAGMNNSQAPKAVSLIYKEIEAILKNGISQKLLEKTKEQIISGFVIGLESTSSRMTRLGGSVLLDGRIMSPEESITGLESTTTEDISLLMNRVFNFDMLSISVVGNTKNIYLNKKPFKP